AESYFDDAHSLSLDARQAVYGPGQFVVQPRVTEWRHFAAEALDHSDFVGLNGVESVEYDERSGGDQGGFDEFTPAFDQPTECVRGVDLAKPVPSIGSGRRRKPFPALVRAAYAPGGQAAARTRRARHAQQAQRVHHYEER